MTRRYKYAPRLPQGSVHEIRPHWCDLCDYGFSVTDEGDLAAHDGRHARTLAMVRAVGPLMTRAQRLAVEDVAAAVLQSSLPLADKIAAAETVLQAHHQKYLRRLTMSVRRSPPRAVDDFIAAANLEGIFDPGIARALRLKYGKAHLPLIAMTDWNYPP